MEYYENLPFDEWYSIHVELISQWNEENLITEWKNVRSKLSFEEYKRIKEENPNMDMKNFDKLQKIAAI